MRGSDIAQKLGITRQAISKALGNVDSKILRILREKSRMIGLVTTFIVEKGIPLGVFLFTAAATFLSWASIYEIETPETLGL